MSQFFPFTYRIPLLVDPIRLHLFTIQRTTAVGLKYWVGSVRKFVLPPPKVDRPMHRWDKASSPTPAVFGSQLHPLWYHIYFRVFDSRWNSMTDDSPERELDTDDLLQHYPRVVQTNHKGHSNLAGDVSSSTEVRTHKTPRREVRWKLDKSAKNQSLESIVRCFEDYLDCVSASSADSPLRHITASPQKWVPHRCPGYLREEITLMADVSRSFVIAHQYPSQSEICTICGQLVQYPINPLPPSTTKRRQQPPLKIDIPTPSIPRRRNSGLFGPPSPSDSHCEFWLFAKSFGAHTFYSCLLQLLAHHEVSFDHLRS